MRRSRTRLAIAALIFCHASIAAQTPDARTTDLDAFMARALQRRDIDRKTLDEYVLDEVEEFEVLGPGRVPFTRMSFTPTTTTAPIDETGTPSLLSGSTTTGRMPTRDAFASIPARRF